MLKLVSAICVMCLCLSCNTTDNKLLSIKFSADRSSILISNIEAAALLQLKNNINTDTMYQQIVSVLETPSDDDSTSMEREWKGKLSMKGDELEFKPDSPFLKGKSYLIETRLNGSFGDIEQVMKGNVRKNIPLQQQLLKR